MNCESGIASMPGVVAACRELPTVKAHASSTLAGGFDPPGFRRGARDGPCLTPLIRPSLRATRLLCSPSCFGTPVW